MDDSRKTFIRLFLIIFIICTLAYAVSAQENGTKDSIQQEAGISTTRNDNISELSQNIDGDSVIGVQSDLDRSLDILNVVATLLGVLVTVLALIIAIVGGLGFLEIRKWREVRANIDEDVTTIKEIRNKAEDELDILRKEIKNNPLPSLNEKPSEEIMKNLDDFASRLELFEIMGASLNFEDYYSRATDLYFKGKHELALKSIEKAIELNPDDYYSWYVKVMALSNINLYDEALRAIEKAIELNPDYADARSYKGVLLFNLGRYDESLKLFEREAEINPDFGTVWYNYACIYYSIKGDKEKSLSFLRKAIEIEDSFKEKARDDKDFEKLWADEDFKKLTE